MNNLRTYEISIWTIQDEFISVLESAFLKERGKTQNGQMTLDVDGTQELSFSIPKFLRENGEKRINPSWEIIHEGNLLVNTRKVKIIFNKNTVNQEIYEFVIDKIAESHNNDELMCEVTCTGLAFFELGKIGYKISLSKEDFYEDDLKWFNQVKDENGKLYFKKQPIANIQYWLNKFLDKIPDEENIYDDTVLKRNKWYYTIQMNWEHYYNNYRSKRNPHKVYEDDERFFYIDMAQVSTTLVNKSMVEDEDSMYKEKARMVDLSESNIYNLTQNIAETFGVYCKYIYLHDENFYITGRIIFFYNSFLYDDNNLNITYRYQTDSIQRDIDSSDIITKMYVKTVEDYISIIDVENNPSREDYLLNFDYLHEIGTISDEAYDYVKTYEDKMKNFNIQLKPLNLRVADLENSIIDVKAKIALLNDSIKLSEETVTRNNEAAKRFSDVSHRTNANPDQKVLLLDSESNDTLYYIDVSNIKGLKEETLKIYKKLNAMSNNLETRLSEEITGYKVEYDDFNNNIKITNIPLEDDESYIVYLTYSWEPSLYYYNIAAVWQQRLNKDKKELDAQNNKLTDLEQSLTIVQNRQKKLIKEKEEEIKYFEEFMGPALREGYWQPENYSDYGDTYVSNYLINDETNILTGSSSYDYFIWDEDLFPEEQDIKYELGVTQDITYYPCIDLSSVWNRIKDNLSELSFLYYDFYETELRPHDYSELKVSHFNSTAKVCFVKKNNKVRPILLLTGLSAVKNDTLQIIKNNKSYIGKYDVNFINGKVYYSIRSQIEVGSSGLNWLTLDSSFTTVYPRICIESLNLKIDDINLSIVIDNQKLKNYTDYLINTKTAYSRTRTYLDENNQTQYILDSNYYITFQISAIIKFFTTELKGNSNSTDFATHTVSLFFTLSNADSAIYYDAVNILKDSSKPKVSYELSMNIFKNNNCIKMPSKYLNHIIGINDYELKFENVKGYISKLTLDLDHPWQDSIEIKNYTTKFEDLFTTILAQTEAMQKSSYLLGYISSGFDSNGQINKATIQTALNKFNFDYAFNNGKLTINEEDGIWAISDSGVVAMRGGGIFCATEQDENGKWIWNTGIVPEGINGSLITAGQIDTSKLRIYAGDKIRFQMNEDGLFAYKSFFEDFDALYNQDFENEEARVEIVNKMNQNGEVDASQYVKFNENGLFLIAKQGAQVLNNDQTDYVVIGSNETPLIGPLENEELKRVSISWDGLTLRNYQNERVFFANADTGDLTLTGTIYANAGVIGPWNISEEAIFLGENNFGTAGSIYFGLEGLSFGDLFKINLDLINHNFNSLIISNNEIASIEDDSDDEEVEDDDDNEDNNYFFKIAKEKDEEDEEEKYIFDLRNVEFGQDLIDSITSNISNSLIYATSEVDGVDSNGEDIPLFPDDAPNGALGVLYSDEVDESESADTKKFKLTSKMYNTTSKRNYLRPGLIKLKEYAADPTAYKRAYKKYFGIKADVWNGVSANATWAEQNFPWVIVGKNKKTDEFHALMVKVQPNKKLKEGKSFTIRFSYKTKQTYAQTDYLDEKQKRSQGIVVNMYKATDSGNPQKKGTLVASGIYKVPFSSGHINSTERIGRVSLTVTAEEGIVTKTNNDKTQYYFIVFYSKMNYSKIYINYESVGTGTVGVTDKRAIYVKSADSWRLISGSSGVPAYLLPKASKKTLGGVRIGDGISVDDDGTISVEEFSLPVASSTVLGGIKIGDRLSISEDGILSADEYILPVATSDILGGIKVGNGLLIDENGVLSNNYQLPVASDSILGGIKINTNDFAIDSNSIMSLNSNITAKLITDVERNKLSGLKLITSKVWTISQVSVINNTVVNIRIDDDNNSVVLPDYTPFSIIINHTSSTALNLQASADLSGNNQLFLHINNFMGSDQTFSGTVTVYYIKNS